MIEYAASVWDSYKQTNINKLEQIQRYSARYITGNYTFNSVSLTRYATSNGKLWKCNVSKASPLTLMFKMVNNLVETDTTTQLKFNQSNTRKHDFHCNCLAY